MQLYAQNMTKYANLKTASVEYARNMHEIWLKYA